MIFMRLRRSVLAAVLTAGLAVPVVVTGAADAAPPAASSSSSSSGKKAAVFAANGTVSAVDVVNGTVTLYAKGGTKNVRRQTVTVAVPDGARIRVNGKKATLDAVGVGYRIDVTGRRVDGVWTASVVVAKKKPTPSASPTPSSPESSDDD